MRRHALTLVAVLLTVTPLACAKRKPAPPPAEIPAPYVAEVQPGVRPATTDPAAEGLPSELVELNAELARRGLLGDVYFEFDQSYLDAAARDRLTKNADFLNAHREYVVSIEGHCDERGTNEYNLALGARRAGAARDHLLALGLEPARLTTMSYGEEHPQCDEVGEECWARNRRAHFVITARASGE